MAADHSSALFRLFRFIWKGISSPLGQGCWKEAVRHKSQVCAESKPGVQSSGHSGALNKVAVETPYPRLIRQRGRIWSQTTYSWRKGPEFNLYLTVQVNKKRVTLSLHKSPRFHVPFGHTGGKAEQKVRFCPANRLQKQKVCFSKSPEDRIYQEDGYERKIYIYFQKFKGIKRKRE